MTDWPSSPVNSATAFVSQRRGRRMTEDAAARSPFQTWRVRSTASRISAVSDGDAISTRTTLAAKVTLRRYRLGPTESGNASPSQDRVPARAPVELLRGVDAANARICRDAG